MIKYEDFKKGILKDPEVKTAYDELSCEYDIIQALTNTHGQACVVAQQPLVSSLSLETEATLGENT